MTYNIWDLIGRQPAVVDIANAIRCEGMPDLIMLQEVRGENMAVLLSKALGLSHHLYLGLHVHGVEDFGLAMISRYPLNNSKFLYFKNSRMGRAALSADVIVNGRKVCVCTVHLDRIDSIKIHKTGIEISWGGALRVLINEILKDTVRSRSAEELLGWIGSGNPDGLIIGGDFNTIIYSKTIRKIARFFKDALLYSQDYFTGSYLRGPLPVGPRLDFLFHSSDVECLGASVVKKSAGDHYPVRADFDMI
jgi:endonuclease/exonuclease/phosphatase family metal-dependent hydrolase